MKPPPRITSTPFGALPDGVRVDAWHLRNRNGMAMEVIGLGGIIRTLQVPDARGIVADVVLGYDTIDEYLESATYFGALIGRCANRIADGAFTLDGVRRELDRNDGAHHLHGGNRGFDQVVWQVEGFTTDDAPGVRLTHVSPAGDAGYPGQLSLEVTYTLTDDNTVTIVLSGVTDAATPVNLTQHSYFNLAGAGNGDILGHELAIHARHYTPVDATLIPTGVIARVDESPFDFRVPRLIGAQIDALDVQLRFGRGYDHNWVLDRAGSPSGVEGPALAASARDPASGRTLAVLTTEPGVQFYSGNRLSKRVVGKGGAVYDKRSGFCLETQHFPNSPNEPVFPGTILRPGAAYHSTTVWRFGAG